MVGKLSQDVCPILTLVPGHQELLLPTELMLEEPRADSKHLLLPSCSVVLYIFITFHIQTLGISCHTWSVRKRMHYLLHLVFLNKMDVYGWACERARVCVYEMAVRVEVSV